VQQGVHERTRDIHHDTKNIHGDTKEIRGDIKEIHSDTMNIQNDTKNILVRQFTGWMLPELMTQVSDRKFQTLNFWKS